MTEERKISKKNNNMFELVTNNKEAKLTQIKEYTKQELTDIYKQLSIQKAQVNMQKVQLQKQLDSLNLPEDKEIEMLSEKLELAQKFLQAKDIKKKLLASNDDFVLFMEQMKEIKGVIPEIDRIPKK